MIFTRQYWRMGLLALLVGVIALVLIVSQAARVDRVDMLAYFAGSDSGGALILYNPDTGERLPLLTDLEFLWFLFGPDGRLAYFTGDADLYVLDTRHPDRTPLSVVEAGGFPVAWSPDGHYLAFSPVAADASNALNVWDGERIINITPHDSEEGRTYNGTWSNDGRFAFTAWYVGSVIDEPPEIYLWDGHMTMNLSQNPTGEDRSASWGDDGRLAFLSEWDGDYDIFVWDGVSFRDGLPDRDTFTNVTPELTAYYSFPHWTNDGRLAFTTTGPQDSYAQIYVWDGQTATNISQNPALHNSASNWIADGRWASTTFFSSQQLVYVHDAENRVLFSAEGQGGVLNSNGHLLFCRRDASGWTLLMWDGQQTLEIVRGYRLIAQWQSGPATLCSSG